MTEPAKPQSEQHRRPRVTLRAKVLLYFGVPALLILGALAALLPRANDRAAETLAGERNGEIASLLAQQLSRELIEYVGVLDRVAARPEIYQFEPAAQRLALRAFVGQLRPFDAGVVVADEGGRVVAADARAQQATGEDWSGYSFGQRSLAGSVPAVISDVEMLASGRVVAIALPIRVPGHGQRGFIAGLFRLDPNAPNGLRDTFVGLPAGENRRLIVIDSASRAIFHPVPQFTGAVFERYPIPESREASRYRPPEREDEELLVAATRVPETGWRLVLEEPWSGLANAYRGATRLVLSLLLLGVTGPVLIAAIGLDRITRSIRALTIAVRSTGDGELGGRVEVRTGDELELLAEQFNEMSARLAASYADLEQRVAERTAELNRLYEQAKETATLAERNRLARELHDSVTQTIFSAKLIADVLPRLWEKDPRLAATKLIELRELTAGALAEMRSLLVELRPAALTEADLGELLTNLGGAAQARGRIAVSVEAEKGIRLPPDTQEAFYRIAQEALNNALKHAQASSIAIRLAAKEDRRRVRLEVEDDGLGFDTASGSARGHLGLGIMAERAAGAGSELVVGSAPGCGTRVTLSWEPAAAS